MQLVLLIALIPILIVLMTPVLLIQRYRVGTARRIAKSWVATLGLISMSLSVIFFLITASMTTIWVPYAFTYSIEGILTGIALGALGVLVAKWESSPRALHYTPNRWMVLAMTLLVSGRVVFGFYRSARALEAGLSGASAIASFGIPQSLAAGGVVIGYYLAFNAGLRWRIRRWQHRALRPM